MLNVKYAHRGTFRTTPNIYDGAFFTSVKPYFKNVLNLIELPLGSIFYTTHPFVKKLTSQKLQQKRSFVNHCTFFLKFEIMQWNGIINKEGFLDKHLWTRNETHGLG